MWSIKKICPKEQYLGWLIVHLQVMQTNVPKPFGIKGKAPVHLNMPGGQWSQDDKYVSGELQQHHHSTITSVKKPGISSTSRSSSGVRLGLLDPRAPWNNSLGNRRLVTWCGNVRIDDLGSSCYPTCHNNVCLSNNPAMCNRYMYGTELMGNVRFFHAFNVQKQSSNESQQENAPKAQLSSKQKLQRAVKEYGTTVIVFHVSISLASLGICYLLVSRWDLCSCFWMLYHTFEISLLNHLKINWDSFLIHVNS